MKLKRTEYLQVVGLLALAPRHNQALKDIEEAIAAVVGEEPDGGYYGHVSDAVYNGYSADKLLAKLGAERKIKAKARKK
jgi:hypothetical protein